MSSFSVLVLGFLFVSFRPSRFRSHSRSTGASLLLSLSGFPLSSAFFRPLPFGSDYSAFRLSFPCFPFSPVGGSFGACRFLASPTLSSSVRPVSMPLFRFRYSAFCSSFLRRRLASQWLPRRLDLVLSVSAAPLGFRFRFGYSAQMSSPRGHPSTSDVTSAANFDILTRLPAFVNTFFKIFQ